MLVEYHAGKYRRRPAGCRAEVASAPPSKKVPPTTLPNQSVQAHGQASENERHCDQNKTCLEEPHLDIVHAAIILLGP
jgi:hypothetical protein